MRTIVIMAALCAVAGCKKNPAYCAVDGDCASHSCMLPAHQCATAPPGSDLAMTSTDMATGCVQPCSGTTPICVMPSCQACTVQSDPDAACATINGGATPHCITSGSDAGSCVGCRDGADCTDPAKSFCDPTAHACRGCLGNAECTTSLVCDRIPGSQTNGRCVDINLVNYVDPTNGNDSNTGAAPNMAFKTIMKALTKTAGRPYIHLVPGMYQEQVIVNSGTAIFVGDPGATLTGKTSGSDAFNVNGGGAGANATVVGIIFSTTNGNGANCQGTSTFSAYQSQFVNNSQTGIVTTGGNCKLLVDGCWLANNMQGGFSLGGPFTIDNSIIAHNMGGGVNEITAGSTMNFVNNTVADNSSGVTAGVNCVGGSFNVVNSILYGNKGGGGAIAETNCTVTNAASDDPANATVNLLVNSPKFVKYPSTPPYTPADYHLQSGSPCRGAGTATGAPDHDYDLQNRPDPTSGLVDIGADEYYP